MASRQDRSRQGVVGRARVLRVRRAAGGLLAATVLAGCAVGGGATGQGPSSSPRPDLAARAEVAARNLELAPGGAPADAPADNRSAGGRGRQAGRSGPGGGTPSGGPGAAPGSASGEQAAPATAETGAGAGGGTWSSVLDVHDPSADQGAAPAYADVVATTFEDDGRHLRVTVRLDGAVPGRLADHEVEGIGIDLFRENLQESDYQVYLDGGAHGWRGFLQTPQGFVRYPGTLELAGRALTATLPWSSLGGRRDGQVSAFVDWSDGSGRAGSDQVERGPLRLP